MKKLFPLLLATALIVPSVSCKKEAGPVYPTFPNYEKQAETTPGAATDVKDDAAYLDGVFSDALSSLNSDEILLFLQNIQSLQFLSDEKTDVSIFQTTIMAAMMEAGEDFPGLSLDLLSGSYALELMGEVWTVNRKGDLPGRIRLSWTDAGVEYLADASWTSGEATLTYQGMPILLPAHLEVILQRKGKVTGALALNFAPAPNPKATMMDAQVSVDGQLVIGSQMLEIKKALIRLLVEGEQGGSNNKGDLKVEELDVVLYGQGARLVGISGSGRYYTSGDKYSNGDPIIKTSAEVDVDVLHRLTGHLAMNDFYNPHVDKTDKLQMTLKGVFISKALKFSASYAPEWTEASPDMRLAFTMEEGEEGYEIVPAFQFKSQEYKELNILSLNDFVSIDNFPLSYYEIIRLGTMFSVVLKSNDD